MKLCTKVKVEAAQVTDGVHLVDRNVQLVDISMVTDDHEFGVDAQGFLHIEGGQIPPRDESPG